jgi:hypothetical protein
MNMGGWGLSQPPAASQLESILPFINTIGSLPLLHEGMGLGIVMLTPESRNKPLLDNTSVNTFSTLRSQQWDLSC